MARAVLDFTYNRNKGVKMTPLDMSFLTGDKNGHEFRIHVVDNNGPVDLTGEEITGWLIPDDRNRTDDITVPMTGTAEGNVAVLVLSEACYTKVGRFSLVIKAGEGEEDRSAVFWATGSMLRTSTDQIADTGVIPSLDELLAQISAMEAATKEANDAAETADDATFAANTAAGKADTAAMNADEKASAANAAAINATNAIAGLDDKVNAAVEERIATITDGLADGSDYAAEVVSARTDENGVTHTSLKTRINEGLTQLKESIDALGLTVVDGTLCMTYEEE